MNNSKINLLPNSKHLDGDDQTKNKNQNPKRENFSMHIPDDDENNYQSDQPIESEDNNQIANEDKNKEQIIEESPRENVEDSHSNYPKTLFFKKLRNIFFGK